MLNDLVVAVEVAAKSHTDASAAAMHGCTAASSGGGHPPSAGPTAPPPKPPQPAAPAPFEGRARNGLPLIFVALWLSLGFEYHPDKK